MSDNRNSLTLVIPGLLAPEAVHLKELGEEPACAALELLLARADKTDTHPKDPDRLLFELFGIDIPADRDAPVAAVTRRAHQAGDDDSYWLHADPVHLQPGNDELVMAAWGDLDLTHDEAGALADEINTVFAENGWTLEVHATHQWHLRLPQPPAIRTAPPRGIRGQAVGRHLPRGEGAEQWRVWINEIQMILHQSPVNRERQSAGKPAVNSLWFWGGGARPAIGELGWNRVWTGDPPARGLAALAGVDCRSLPENFAELEGDLGGAGLAVFPETGRILDGSDFAAWLQRVEVLEQDWFAPALEALKRGGLDELVLHPADGHAHRLDRRRLKKWWRRPRSLSAHLT